MSNDSVLIGYIHSQMIHCDFMHALLQAIVHDSTHERHLNSPGGWGNVFSGPNVSHSRNDLVNRFLAGQADWLLMLDTDIVFPPFLPHLMVTRAHELDATVLSGMYWGARNNTGSGMLTFPLAFISTTDNVDDMKPIAMVPAQPIPVDGVGAGCLLVHRRALEDLRDAKVNAAFPYFQETDRGGKIMSEDLEFCIRLAKLGHTIWFDPSIEVGHLKMIPLIRELTGKPLITMETFTGELEYVPAPANPQNGLPPRAKKKAKRR